MLRVAQQQAFSNLVETLETHYWNDISIKKRGRLSNKVLMPIFNFCPLLDDGVIRVGGRFQQPSMSKDFKHPVASPKRHHLTGLIIDDMHRKSGHHASGYVIGELRERFHVMGQESTVKYYIVKNCMICNCKTKAGSHFMTPLPLGRVEPRGF